MFAVLSLLLGIATSAPPSLLWQEETIRNFDDIDHFSAFLGWREHFDKDYADAAEEEHRFLLFVENWRLINDHNLGGRWNYTMGLNQFGDLTQEEVLYQVHGHAKSCLRRRDDAVYRIDPAADTKVDSVTAPAAIDWTDINGTSYVTPVKDQKNCGSCWAFSTVGSLESFAAIRAGVSGAAIAELSEQQLVDCTYAVPDGCQGGLQEDGFAYIARNGGLCSSADYPYTGRDGACKAATCGAKVDATAGYKAVAKNEAAALVDALAVGPIAVSVDAAGPGWTYYKSGVYSAECGVSLDHGVVGVGYGHAADGGEFWKIKNSWGTSWGMDGYMLICRNCGKNGNRGECGILEDNTYPTFE